MRTEHEIVERCRELGRTNEDFFGFQRSDLLPFVSFEAAREFLNDSATAENWEHKPLSDDAVRAEMLDYVDFAWGKALDHRGLSAERSIEHYKAWIWLLGDEFPEAGYKNYGAPTLLAICKKYELPMMFDSRVERMADGLPCRPGCSEGCAR